MSGNYVGFIDSPSQGQLPFSTVRMPTGRPLDISQILLQEISTPGVDSRRYRETMAVRGEFVMQTMRDFASYADAVSWAQSYESTQGEVVGLSLALRDFGKYWKNVLVVDVKPIVTAGVVSGFGSDPNSAAMVTATWKFYCTANAA